MRTGFRSARSAGGAGSDVGWHLQRQKTPPRTGVFALEAPPGIGPGMKVLQTSALPLGYGAGGGSDRGCGALNGVRTGLLTDGTKRKPEPTRALNPGVGRRFGYPCLAGTTPRISHRSAARNRGSNRIRFEKEREGSRDPSRSFFGADYGARTRHLDLGKVALYQMS